MAECWACGSALDPAWRFCVRCGVPVERDEKPDDYRLPPATSLGPFAIAGIVLGGVAALAAAVAVVALVLPS